MQFFTYFKLSIQTPSKIQALSTAPSFVVQQIIFIKKNDFPIILFEKKGKKEGGRDNFCVSKASIDLYLSPVMAVTPLKRGSTKEI